MGLARGDTRSGVEDPWDSSAENRISEHQGKKRDKTFKPLSGAKGGKEKKNGRHYTKKGGSQRLKDAWGPPVQKRFGSSFPRRARVRASGKAGKQKNNFSEWGD